MPPDHPLADSQGPGDLRGLVARRPQRPVPLRPGHADATGLVPIPGDWGIPALGPSPEVGILAAGVLGTGRHPDVDGNVPTGGPGLAGRRASLLRAGRMERGCPTAARMSTHSGTSFMSGRPPVPDNSAEVSMRRPRTCLHGGCQAPCHVRTATAGVIDAGPSSAAPRVGVHSTTGRRRRQPVPEVAVGRAVSYRTRHRSIRIFAPPAACQTPHSPTRHHVMEHQRTAFAAST